LNDRLGDGRTAGCAGVTPSFAASQIAQRHWVLVGAPVSFLRSSGRGGWVRIPITVVWMSGLVRASVVIG
jgi:hypothetical protein